MEAKILDFLQEFKKTAKTSGIELIPRKAMKYTLSKMWVTREVLNVLLFLRKAGVM